MTDIRAYIFAGICLIGIGLFSVWGMTDNHNGETVYFSALFGGMIGAGIVFLLWALDIKLKQTRDPLDGVLGPAGRQKPKIGW